MRYIGKDQDGFHFFDDSREGHRFEGELWEDCMGDTVFAEDQGLDSDIEPEIFDKAVTKPRLYEYIPFSKILFIGELNPTHHKRGMWIQSWGGYYDFFEGTGQTDYQGELTGDYVDEFCCDMADEFIVPILNDQDIFYVTEIHIIPDMRFFN